VDDGNVIDIRDSIMDETLAYGGGFDIYTWGQEENVQVSNIKGHDVSNVINNRAVQQPVALYNRYINEFLETFECDGRCTQPVFGKRGCSYTYLKGHVALLGFSQSLK
jgi:hypothetical protein